MLGSSLISKPPDDEARGDVATANLLARASASPPWGAPTGLTIWMIVPEAVNSGIVVETPWMGGAVCPAAGGTPNVFIAPTERECGRTVLLAVRLAGVIASFKAPSQEQTGIFALHATRWRQAAAFRASWGGSHRYAQMLPFLGVFPDGLHRSECCNLGANPAGPDRDVAPEFQCRTARQGSAQPARSNAFRSSERYLARKDSSPDLEHAGILGDT